METTIKIDFEGYWLGSSLGRPDWGEAAPRWRGVVLLCRSRQHHAPRAGPGRSHPQAQAPAQHVVHRGIQLRLYDDVAQGPGAHS
jgi:hypothetical protein